MGKLTLLLLALLVWLQYSLWFGKNGLHDYSRVNDDVSAQQATISCSPKLTTSTAVRKLSKSARAMNSV